MALSQPTPTVTRADVERVARRDFGPERFRDVMALLDEYGREAWQREAERVQLAVLKLAAGDMDTLRRQMDWARLDYRDVLAPAEYPGYLAAMSGMNCVAAEERQRVIEQDWRQYQAWLGAAGIRSG